MKDGLYTFEELSQYMDKAQEPLRELLKASQEREKLWRDELINSHSKVEEMQKALEWAARIIDSGMYKGVLQYDPKEWFSEYWKLKGVTNEQ